MSQVAEIRARMERAAARLEERIEDATLRSTERQRLSAKLEGLRLALSYVKDEEAAPTNDVPDFDRVLEPVLGMFRAQMRADVWHDVWAEAAKAQRKSVDEEDRLRDHPSPAPREAQRRESEVLGRMVQFAAGKEKAARDGAEKMRRIAESEKGRPFVR